MLAGLDREMLHIFCSSIASGKDVNRVCRGDPTAFPHSSPSETSRRQIQRHSTPRTEALLLCFHVTRLASRGRRIGSLFASQSFRKVCSISLRQDTGMKHGISHLE